MNNDGVYATTSPDDLILRQLLRRSSVQSIDRNQPPKSVAAQTPRLPQVFLTPYGISTYTHLKPNTI